MYKKALDFVYPEREVNHDADLSIEICRCIRNAWCSCFNCALERYDLPKPPLELRIRMLKVEVLETKLYSCVT